MPTTNKDRVYKLIRRAIIAGDLESGRILTIGEMSSLFKAGKTPTREALIVLGSEGFIESIPRSGYMIRPISIQDVLEIFHLRTLLEVEGIGLAVDRLTQADLVRLRDSLVQEAALSATPRGPASYRRAYDLNKDFHLTIAQASGNSRLRCLVGQHIDEMERILARDPYIVDPHQHSGIVDALETRDKAKAQLMMKQHLEETKARLMSRF